MSLPDLAVIAAYLGLVFAVNRYWASRVDFAGWLTSKRTVGWRFLMFTVVSTNVGAGTILGTAGRTFQGGIGWGLTSGVGALFGYWLMAGFVRRIARFTGAGERSSFQEFFRRRYSRSVQAAAGIVVALLYFFYLAAQFKGLGAIFEVWGGLETRTAGLVAALLVIWLTAGAGIRSDMYTDALHFWAMIVTIGAACAIEISRLGGFAGLSTALAPTGGLAAALDPFAFGGATYVGMGILVGSFLGLPSMEVWQRVDAARSERDARRAFLWAGVLNALFFTAAILLGLVARAALAGDVPRNQVLFRLLERTLPPGLLGLAVVGAYAAFMSTANSMLMVSVASLLSDVVCLNDERLARRRSILAWTRGLTWGVGLTGLFIAWARPDIVSLIMTALWGSGVLLPAILGGFFWKRGTSAGAWWSIVLGFLLTTGLGFWWRNDPWWSANYWIPGLAAAAAAYVGISLATRHARSERGALAA